MLCIRRGGFNEYTQHKKISLNYSKLTAMGFVSKGIKNEFERAVINEPSVFEPLKVDCISFSIQSLFEANI